MELLLCFHVFLFGSSRCIGRTGLLWLMLLLVVPSIPLATSSSDASLTRTLQHARSQSSRSFHPPTIISLRGGSTDPSLSSASAPIRPPPIPSSQAQAQAQQPPPPPPSQTQAQELQHDQGLSFSQQQQPQPPSYGNNEADPFQETFQERVDNWRNYQLEHSAEQQASPNPRDEKGRIKLLTSVSKGSRALTFFLLMWRNVHLYETVDQAYKGTVRFIGVIPLTILFVANMAGVVASITSPGHSAKKRLKAILNLDKLLEMYLIIWSLIRLIFAPSKLIPREIYISHILHSFFFILQCQAVTRLTWDEVVPSINQPSTAMNSAMPPPPASDGAASWDHSD